MELDQRIERATELLGKRGITLSEDSTSRWSEVCERLGRTGFTETSFGPWRDGYEARATKWHQFGNHEVIVRDADGPREAMLMLLSDCLEYDEHGF